MPGYVPRLIARQKQHCKSDVLRAAGPQQRTPLALQGRGRGRGTAWITGELRLQSDAVLVQPGLDRAGADRVAAEVPAGILHGDLAREADDAGLGGGVGRVVRVAV